MAKKDQDQTPTSFSNPELDEANRRGYLGTVPDDTPNEAYSLQGVTSGQPTPETVEPDQGQPDDPED